MIFRLYYVQKGGHTHCRLFSGPREGALGKCGDLVFRNEEFEVFRKSESGMIQFKPEFDPEQKEPA